MFHVKHWEGIERVTSEATVLTDGGLPDVSRETSKQG